MSKQITNNRKAYYEYQILEKFIAGIQLQGSEVKSIKANNIIIEDGFCIIRNGEVFIKNIHIGEYKQSGKNNNHLSYTEKVSRR